MSNLLRYNINLNGIVTAIGYLSQYKNEVSVEPFSLDDAYKWQKDLATGKWIYLPDITPVDKTIIDVRYDWSDEKAYITIADQFNSGPHEFDCNTTWSDADCLEAIGSKFPT